jgi:outer membrane lipoprotein-sorting protein
MILIRNILLSIICLSILLLICGGCQPSNNQTVSEQPAVTEVQNNSPVISDLMATDAVVQPQGRTRITCQATDADNDNLTYKWTVSAGIIEGDGSTILWTAPVKSGPCSISVAVSDGKGGSASQNVIIQVPEKPNNSPLIKTLRFTRYNHKAVFIDPNGTEKELKDAQVLLVVKKLDPVELSVLASDPDNDPLDYRWTSNPGGTIKGDGNTVWWYAPSEAGDFKITIEVTDERGGSASYTITVTVKCCGV